MSPPFAHRFAPATLPTGQAASIPRGDSVEGLLRAARIGSGWTQSQLAQAVGVTRQHISACERGDTPLRFAGLQRLLEPLGLVARITAEPLRGANLANLAVLPLPDRLPIWTAPILAAAPRTTITGALGLRVWGAPIDVDEVELVVQTASEEAVVTGLARAGYHPGPGGVTVRTRRLLPIAFDHVLLPRHTVIPVALNDHWSHAERDAWIRDHGERS